MMTEIPGEDTMGDTTIQSHFVTIGVLVLDPP
jgi:hypothetical protein